MSDEPDFGSQNTAGMRQRTAAAVERAGDCERCRPHVTGMLDTTAEVCEHSDQIEIELRYLRSRLDADDAERLGALILKVSDSHDSLLYRTLHLREINAHHGE